MMMPRLPNRRAPPTPPPSQICGLFGLSYLCSMLFNINNKRALMLVPLPWTFAALNLSIGSVIALLSWSIKIAPWPRITRQVHGRRGFAVCCRGGGSCREEMGVVLLSAVTGEGGCIKERRKGQLRRLSPCRLGLRGRCALLLCSAGEGCREERRGGKVN